MSLAGNSAFTIRSPPLPCSGMETSSHHLMEKSCRGDKATQPSGHLCVPRSVRNTWLLPTCQHQEDILGHRVSQGIASSSALKCVRVISKQQPVNDKLLDLELS